MFLYVHLSGDDIERYPNAPAAKVLARLQSVPGEAKEKGRHGRFPLHNALYRKHPAEVVTAVLAAHPAAASRKDDDEKHPLYYAFSRTGPCYYYRPEVVTAVLAAHPAAAEGVSLVDLLRVNAPAATVLARLQSDPAAAQGKDGRGNHPLLWAQSKKHPAKVVAAVLAAYPAAAAALPYGDMGVIQSLSDKHGHTLDHATLHSAAALFVGTSAALQWITAMLAKAPADQHVKAAVLQMLGNSYRVATGHPDAARLFKQLKAEADGLLNRSPAALHAHAVERGFAADIGTPALRNADASQAGVLELVAPWLVREAQKVARNHKRDVEAKQETHVTHLFIRLMRDPYMVDPACVDPGEVVLAAMCVLGHAATACLRRTHPALGAAFGSLLWADAKTFDRMRIKWKSEYAGRFELLLDFIRFSLTSPDQAAQEAFLASTREPGSAFAVRRIKSTHSDPAAQIKQCLVNLEWDPGMTFDELLAGDGALGTAMDAARQANPGVSAPLWRAAEELLAEEDDDDYDDDDDDDESTGMNSNERLRKAPVRIVVEAQLYIPFFLDARKQLHIFYKVSRAKGLAELAQDCAKYATNAEMAFAPEDPETRRGWVAAAVQRLAAWAGLDLMAGTAADGKAAASAASAEETPDDACSVVS